MRGQDADLPEHDNDAPLVIIPHEGSGHTRIPRPSRRIRVIIPMRGQDLPGGIALEGLTW